MLGGTLLNFAWIGSSVFVTLMDRILLVYVPYDETSSFSHTYFPCVIETILASIISVTEASSKVLVFHFSAGFYARSVAFDRKRFASKKNGMTRKTNLSCNNI